jgi:hypothetical protein
VEEKENGRWKKRGRRRSPRPSKIRWRREEELAADLASSPQPSPSVHRQRYSLPCGCLGFLRSNYLDIYDHGSCL